jgi:glycosyltransferase involved in cell wall biosynthesis
MLRAPSEIVAEARRYGTLTPTPTVTGAKRLKIAYVHDGLYPFFKGGAERRFHQTAHSLAERNDVTYISWQYWQGPASVTQSNVRYVGVGPAPDFYGADGKRTVREGLAFARGVVQVLRRERFDVVDCCATPILALYVSWFLSRMQREPLIATWHEYWGDYWTSYLPRRSLVARLAKTLESRAAPLADSIVAVSEFTADKLRAQAPETPIRVIENGVSLDDIDSAPAAPDAPDVIFAGRLIDDKKVDWLLQAVKQVSESSPGLTCGIVGEGPERFRLEHMARALEIHDRVRFFGFVDESRLYGLMKGAQIFVLPSIREGFGMSVVEAQACGTVPVVVEAPYNAAATLIQHEYDGLVCSANATSLAAAIQRLTQDATLRSELSANARRSAQARDWSRISEQLEELYTSVVQSR